MTVKHALTPVASLPVAASTSH